jgi:hypothetical protein
MTLQSLPKGKANRYAETIWRDEPTRNPVRGSDFDDPVLFADV